MSKLQGKVALITGAAKGVGAQTARMFALEGARVAINYLNSRAEAEELASRLPGAMTIQGDISDPKMARRMITAVTTRYGRLDILVNNASHSVKDSWNLEMEKINDDDWRMVMDVDVNGSFFMSKYAAAHLRKAKGSIVNIASASSMMGDETMVLYSACKTAIVGLTKSVAKALAPEVRVNAIAPGSIATEWIEKWAVPQSALRSIVRSTPLRRMGWPEDIASTALFLVSSESSFMTGQTLVVDGGIYMH